MDTQERLELMAREAQLITEIRVRNDWSQQYVASAIGIARSTLQRVENGEMFMAKGPLYDFLGMAGFSRKTFNLIVLNENKFDLEDDEELDEALCETVKSLPMHSKRLLRDMLISEWGGDPLQLIELSAMHSQTKLDQRLLVSETVVHNYMLCRDMGVLAHPEYEQPDAEALQETNRKARDAAVKGNQSY